MGVEKLDVLIPKFSISGSLELREPLGQLGINSLFGGQSNLTGFLDQYDSEDTVSLDSAKHKSFIEVPLRVQGGPPLHVPHLRQAGRHRPLLRSLPAPSRTINLKISTHQKIFIIDINYVFL